MATVRYFYIEDDTGILFGANGTALTASLAVMAGLISDIKFPLPIFPLWVYFLGLVLAFVSKAVISLFNSDVKERERSQSMRDFFFEVQKEGHASEGELQSLWATMETHRKTLLTDRVTLMLRNVRVLTFFGSAICFLVATSSVILFVGSRISIGGA